VADVVKRIVKAAFWNVLADFAVSAVVPMIVIERLVMGCSLTNLSWFGQ
jgi:hypothetical protein